MKPRRSSTHDRAARIDYVRLYHFLSADHALDDIAQKRLKISQIEQLNDPFELWCVYQKDQRLRTALRAYRAQMAARFGVLCFSRHWHNPVLWSHYADRHRGICLGFDVDSRSAKPVAYHSERPRLRIPPSRVDADQLLYTKFLDWQYEEEWRSWIQIDEHDPATGFYFYNFDSCVRLTEVIVGPLCDVPKPQVTDALRDYEDKVSVIKARLAFKTFRVVRNLRGFPQIKLDPGVRSSHEIPLARGNSV